MANQAPTRRAMVAAMAALPAVAALGIPASAAVSDRGAWDRAYLAYEKAQAEYLAFETAFNPLFERYLKERDTIPHLTFRPDPHSGFYRSVTTADVPFVRRARNLVRDVAAGKCRLDPDPSLQAHFQLCQEVTAAADERDAKIAAIRDRLNIDEMNDKSEILSKRLNEADAALMATPAPDHAALLFKLEKLLEVEADGSTACWGEGYMAQTMIDARRLLSGEA